MALPRFIVLESHQNDYLSYKREGVDTDGYLKFSESQAVSPYAKFEVELSKTNGLVHIRSCQNNKYWRRTKSTSLAANPDKECYWITATAENKDENQSAELCTLFKFIPVEPAVNTVRIMNVQSGCYLWLRHGSNPAEQSCVLAFYKVYEPQGCDIFTLIDWSSLLILPRHLAFKGEGAFSGKYLCLCPYQSTSEFLQFVTQDKGDPTVACEIIPTNDGNIRMKQTCTQKFWRRRQSYGGDWLVADSDDTSSDNKDTVFRPTKVDEKTIALINLGNNRFCKRDTNDSTGIYNCLNATAHSIINEVRLTVEEAVMRREIYGSRYDVDNSRVYNQSVIVVSQNSASNHTKETQSLTVKLSYKDTKTRSWKNSFSLSLGVKASMEFEVPFISKAGVEISTEAQSVQDWGETEETSTDVTVEHTVVVPPMTMVTVNLVATRGKCNVPLSYMQKDTLYDGTHVTTEIIGAYFTGANYYNFSYDDKEESLPAVALRLEPK